MANKPSPRAEAARQRRYRGKNIPMGVIRRYARAIAEAFHPEKIILFGSYAYGTPHDDSDVDILVVMPTRSQPEQAVKIRLALRAPFPMDLLVRTPRTLQRRLADGDSFLREIVSKGKLLYEKIDTRVGAEGGRRLRLNRKARAGPSSPS